MGLFGIPKKLERITPKPERVEGNAVEKVTKKWTLFEKNSDWYCFSIGTVKQGNRPVKKMRLTGEPRSKEECLPHEIGNYSDKKNVQ